MSGNEKYDICIIGAGMIGSAAARHATLVSPGAKVCLVGPNEPKNYTEGVFFGEHYDEGRITRQAATDYIWSILATRSIDRYRQIEQLTGIPFYTECGYAVMAPAASPMLAALHEVTGKLGIILRRLTAEEFAARFPYMNNRQQHICEIEETKAGYISPRKLVEAEQKAAIQNGCRLIRDIADKVREVQVDGGQTTVLEVTTAGGHVIHADKVLLATGSYTGFRSLVGDVTLPSLYLHKQTVTLAEIGEDDAQRLRGLPPMYWDGFSMHDIPNSPDPVQNDGLFFLPPIRYPDGKFYLKIGHGRRFEVRLHTEQEVKGAFCDKVSEDVEKAQIAWVKDIFPDVKLLSFHSKCCVMSLTTTYRPFIDLVSPKLGVAIGGNGYAAKSCDEIGRLAASLLVTGKWTDDLPHDIFQLSTDKPITHFVKKLA